MRKRVFAMVLVAALCVSLLPTTAFAEEGEYTVEATEETAETDTQTADIEIAEDGSATIVVSDVDEETESDSVKVKEAEEAVPDESEDVEEAAEEEAEPEETVYTKKDGSIRVEVTAPADALPEGAELSVQRYEKNSQEYRDAAEAIGFEEDQGTDMAAVDISFLLDGEEVEPSEPVKVSIDVSDILPEDTDASTLEVQHLVEKADDTVKPVVVANDSEETEGSIDVKKETAEFEVESFSTFTVTWTWSAGGMGSNSVSVSVTAYLDGTEIDGIGDVTFTSENDELDFYTLLSEVGYGTGDYTFSYAIVNQTYGSQENPVVAIEINQGTGGPTSSTNFLMVYADGTTDTVSTSNAYVSVYYLTPDFSVSIDAVGEDEETEAWALQATLSHAGSYESISYDWTVTDADGSASQYAKVTNTDNTGRAYISWVEGVPDNTEVTVTVTVTLILEDGSTKTAKADYVLEYGDETIDLIMTYGPYKEPLPAGIEVTITSESGNYTYTGETNEKGVVEDIGEWNEEKQIYEIVPGIYIVTATYTDDEGNIYKCNEAVAMHNEGDYSINLNYYSDSLLTEVPTRSTWEHIDIKLSVGTSSNSSSASVSVNIIGAQILDSDGNVKYTIDDEYGSVEGNDNEFQLIFYDVSTGITDHSTSFDTDDTITITYVLTIDGNEQSPTTITITKNTKYDEGTTYPADGQRAYKLYNYLYGTSYNSDAQLIEEGIEEIDISGMSMMLVAAILCDSSDVTGAGTVIAASEGQWGMDFAFSIEALRELAASWAFNIEKTYENASMTAGDFVFYLYSAIVENDAWSLGSLQSTLSNKTAGMDLDGNSYDTMELYSISYSDDDVANGAVYYYILYEAPDTITSASGATITFDSTIFGVKVEVGTDVFGDPEVIATYYRMEQNEDGTYTVAETYTTGTNVEGKITFDEDDYATFEFGNAYQDTTEISGEKIWDDSDNVDNTRPESITINLYQDGELYDSVTVTADDNWEWRFTDLPIYNGVTEYTYTIKEVSVDGYVTTTEINDNGTYTITNTYEPTPEFEPVKDVDADGNGEYGDNGMGVKVGDTLTYKIDYENPYSEAATVTITDTLDEGLTYVPDSASNNGSYDEDSRKITWTISVEALASGSVTFQATVNENAIVERYEVDNTATVTLEVGDDPTTVIEKDTNTVYNPIPDKDVDADGDEVYEDSGMQVEVGGTLVYKIDYENPDDDPATVTITDVVDEGLDFVSATDGGSYDASSRTITWVIEGVAPHTNGSVYFTATVNETALEAGVVENTAKVQVGNHAEQQTKTVYNPLTGKDVDADGDGEYGDNGMGVQVGDTLTYEISYFNGYDDPATVTITDVLDEGLDFVSADNGGTYDESTRTVTWVIKDVGAQTAGSVTFQAIVNENALVRNEVENTATVQVGDDSAVETNTVYNPIPDKDVDADGDDEYKDSGMMVEVGDTLVYKIDYENPDDDKATVTITDELDIGLDFMSATDGGSYDESSRTITWVIENVEAHTNGSVYFTATVNEDALEKHEVDNTAVVQVGNHAEQQTKTVYNPIIPVKGVDADGDGEYDDSGMHVEVGDTLTYEIEYKNSHDEAATITITDVLDIGLDFVEASDGGTYDESTRTITWVLDAEANAFGSVYFTATVNEDALEKHVVENMATVQVGDDPAVDTNTTENPLLPDKDVDADGDGEYGDNGLGVQVGDTLTYIVEYRNSNEEPATVTITDVLDKGLDFVSASDGGSYDEGTRTITWVIEDVKAHTDGYVTFEATVNETALVRNEVDNTATVQVDGHPEVQTNTVYNPIPDKDVDADADGEYGDSGMPVRVGDTLTYKIDYENPDDDPATVTITDKLDIGLEFVSADNGGTYDDDTRTITWVIEGVDAHTNGSVTFEATVNESALERNLVDNTAIVQVGDHPEQETRKVENPLGPEKDVDIHNDDTYGDTGLGVKVGDTLTYEITYFNGNDDPATVTITDVLDEGLDFVEASDGGTYDESTRTITWTIEDAEPHMDGSVTFTATVNETALVRNEVDNTATVQVGDDPETAVDTNTVYNPVPDKDVDADGDGEYKDSGMMVEVGDTLVYKIDYENPDDDPATVTITDELDIGLDYVEATDGGAYDESSRTITWVIENVEAHTNGSVYFTATVNDHALEKHEVENTAVVQVGEHPAQQTKTVYNPLVPAKGVDADGDGEFVDNGVLVAVGDTLTYEIVYKNSDDEPATVTITDVLDEGLDYVDGSASDGGTYDEAARTITWVLDAEANAYGRVTFQATVNETAQAEHEVENTASVQVGDHPAVDTNTVYNPLYPAKDVDADGDGNYGDSGMQVQVGDTLTYKIDFKNTHDVAEILTITDELDEGLDFVSASDGGEYDEAARTITWSLEVEAGVSGSVTFEATVNEKALDKDEVEVENTASVKVGDDPAIDTNTVYNPLKYREYYPIDEEIVTDEDNIFDRDAWVKDESVNEYNAIEFEMTTMLPKISGEDVANGIFTMRFHEVLDHELELDENTADFSVYLYGNTGEPFEIPAVSEDGTTTYYTVTINPEETCTIPGENGEPGQEVQCSFHVEVDLTALYNDGLISDEDLQGDTWITIYFFADLEGKDLNGSYTSTIWYEVYDGENLEYTSNVDVVSVYTYEVEINKVDENGDPLADATFGVYYDENCTDPVLRTMKDENGDSYTEAYTEYSGEDGVVMFYGLAEGTYYVKELAAPTGYVLSDVVITVEPGADTVDEDHIYHTAGVFVNTPSNPDEPQNPLKFVETNGDGDFFDDHLTVNVGDDLTYRIYYYNYNDEAVTVTVKDTLDYALDFVSAKNGGEYDEDSRTITWTVENAAAKTWGYVEFTAKANDLALLQSAIENTASVQIGNDAFVDTNTVENPTPDAEGNPTTGSPKTGTGAPKTGDTNNFGLWLVLLMAAMVGVFAALRMRKRS